MIYYDNAATTPVLPTMRDSNLANPSSPHALGIAAERKLSTSRKRLSGFLGQINKNTPPNIIFTSGGTESNNLALLGFAQANRRKKAVFMAEPWEHPSILEPLKYIKEQGFETIIAPRKEWQTSSSGICLAAISHVNSETGDISDVSAIAASLKKENPATIVLVDGIQGFFKECVDLSQVDMYTFSAHKFHGPTGVGGLAVRPNIRLAPIMYGGGQENKLRPGTENIQGILHMVDVVERILPALQNTAQHVGEIKKILLGLTAELPDVFVNAIASGAGVSSYILNMSFLGVKGEPLVNLLSEKGIYASMGAACRSRGNKKSVLEDMGFSKQRAESAVRFSFSHLNTVDEAHVAKAIIADCVTQLRSVMEE